MANRPARKAVLLCVLGGALLLPPAALAEGQSAALPRSDGPESLLQRLLPVPFEFRDRVLPPSELLHPPPQSPSNEGLEPGFEVLTCPDDFDPDEGFPVPVRESLGDLAPDLLDPDTLDITGCDLTEKLCAATGAANRGRLVNGVRMESSPGIFVREERTQSYGTPETVAAIRYAVARVHQQFPETPDLVVGDLSQRSGGRFPPHVSHQNGRDVDLAYYYKGLDGNRDFALADAKNLDVERTWALLEAMLEDHKVEYIFIDYSIQALLHRHVKYTLGAPQAYLDQVFSYPRGHRVQGTFISHERGHRNHIHVRFWAPIAQAAATGLDLRPGSEGLDPAALATYKRGSYAAREQFPQVDWILSDEVQMVKVWKKQQIQYKVRSGETLAGIAKKHGTSSKNLMAWNGLKKGAPLKAGQKLKLYKQVQVEEPRRIEIAVVRGSSPRRVSVAARPAETGTASDAVQTPPVETSPAQTPPVQTPFLTEVLAQGPSADEELTALHPGNDAWEVELELEAEETGAVEVPENDAVVMEGAGGDAALAEPYDAPTPAPTVSDAEAPVAGPPPRGTVSRPAGDAQAERLTGQFAVYSVDLGESSETVPAKVHRASSTMLAQAPTEQPVHSAPELGAATGLSGPTGELEAAVEETEASKAPGLEPRAASKPAAAKTRAGAGPSLTSGTSRYKTISVQSGDNLWDLARKHHTTVDELRSLNHLKRSATLRLGQTLKVPVSR